MRTASLSDRGCCEASRSGEPTPATARPAESLSAPDRGPSHAAVLASVAVPGRGLALAREVEAARRVASSPPLRVLLCTFLC